MAEEIRYDEKELAIIEAAANLDDDQSLFAAEQLESVKS